MTLSVQFITLFTMIAGGFYVGIAKDTIRRFSPAWEHRVFFTYTIEIIFWLMNTAMLYYVLFIVNAGELRLIIFVAILLGYSMYQALASTIYKRILEFCIRIGTIFFAWIGNLGSLLLVRPIKFIVHLLKKCILLVLSVLGTVLLFMLKVVITPFIWVGKKIYAILPSKIRKIIPTGDRFYSIMKNIAKIWRKIWSSFRR